jgi:predicted helicase
MVYYIYAILNSPSYRKRYAGFLQYDYPRIPVTSNVEKFKALCKLGKTLTQLHLLESVPVVLKVSYPVPGDNIVSKAEYKDGKLFINNNQYFEGIPEEVINFVIGGYQVIMKWFDARKGRKLEYNDIEYLKNKMFNVISFTLMLQKEIDRVLGDFPIT